MADEKKAESKFLSDAEHALLSTINMRINKEGNGLAATDLEGKPLPEESMPADLKAAFKRFEARALPPKPATTAPTNVA